MTWKDDGLTEMLDPWRPLPLPSSSLCWESKIRALAAAGKSTGEIAATVGISQGYVSKLGARWGLVFPRGPRATPSRLAARAPLLRQMHTEGRTLQEMGAVLGVTRERARQLCDRLGLGAEGRYRTRQEASRVAAEPAWEARCAPEMQALLTELRAQGHAVHPVWRQNPHQCNYALSRCFTVEPWTFQVRIGRGFFTPKALQWPSRYYHYHLPRLSNRGSRHLVCIAGDGRRFIFPPGGPMLPSSLYLPEHHDGKWAPYRDAWPWRQSPKCAEVAR
jgi:hypothetical protein